MAAAELEELEARDRAEKDKDITFNRIWTQFYRPKAEANKAGKSWKREESQHFKLRGLPLMTMYNPPHPGELISSVYLEEYNLSCHKLAGMLGVAPSTLARVLNAKSAVSPEIALRLSKVLGRTPESWLAMQANYDLGKARNQVDLSGVTPVGRGVVV
ncbi:MULTISPECIES: HigA family addiction module antitoxin [unclassified Maridesulfovibrio]|uniref:HigA family addiction module antitoxin n=1 Tax=unclassified Maridesulfovibrio TaxID=2794999 RepID=UPI003B3D461F